jgi:hypothetical protein
MNTLDNVVQKAIDDYFYIEFQLKNTMINEYLLSLYDYYRRNSKPSPAIFHTKVVLTFSLFLLIGVIFFTLAVVFGWTVGLYSSGINGSTTTGIFFVVFLAIAVPVFYFTDSYEVLELKRSEADAKYRAKFFFYSSIFLIVFLYMVAEANQN